MSEIVCRNCRSVIPAKSKVCPECHAVLRRKRWIWPVIVLVVLAAAVGASVVTVEDKAPLVVVQYKCTDDVRDGCIAEIYNPGFFTRHNLAGGIKDSTGILSQGWWSFEYGDLTGVADLGPHETNKLKVFPTGKPEYPPKLLIFDAKYPYRYLPFVMGKKPESAEPGPSTK